MNNTELKKFLSSKLESFNEIETEIFRGEHKIKNKVASIYIVDLRDNFDADYLQHLNEEILSKEYFKLEGDLQWNLYYLLKRNNVNEELKIVFENDKNYGRKMVLSPDSFEHFFKKIVFAGKVDAGVYDIWKNKLDNSNLGFVAESSVPYTEGMRMILQTGHELKQKKKKKNASSSVLQIKKIDKLISWDKKRLPASLPDFGQINLISGPNAIGKTSLLEFIEMGICGGTFRNQNGKNKVNLEISYNGGVKDKYDPSDRDKYKDRDFAWYNSANNLFRSNTLVINFGRYNFYDADAAYRISHEADKENTKNSQKQLMDILSQIALGKDMNELEEKVEGYQERIVKEIKSEDKALKEYKQFLKSHQDNLKAVTTIVFDEKKALDEILNVLAETGWLPDVNSYGGQLETLVNDLYFASETLDSFLEIGSEIGVSDLKTLESREKSVSDLAEKIKLAEKETNNLIKRKRLLEDDSKKLESLTKTLEKYGAFFTVQDALDVRELETKLNVIRAKADNIDEAQGMYILGDTDVDIKFNSLVFNDIASKTETEILVLKDKLKNTKQSLIKLEEKENALNSLVGEIRQLSLQYIGMDPGLDACPVCSTNFSSEDLKKKILKDIKKMSGQDDILQLKKLRKELEDSSKIKSELYSALVNLKDTFLKLFPKKVITDETVLQLKETLESEFAAVSELREEVKEYKNKLSVLAKQGVSVSSFNSLREFVLVNGDLELKNENKKKILKWADDLKKKKIEAEKKVSDLQQEIVRLDDSIKFQFKESKLKGSLNELETFNQTQQALVDLRSEYEELEKLFDFESVKSLKVLSNKINSQKDKVDEFVNSKREFDKSVIVKKGYEKEISKYKEKIDGTSAKLKKLNEANLVLEDLQKNYSKDAALDEFFSRNVNAISETYLKIHSPKEFNGLEYDRDEKALYLSRIDSDERVSVSMISSGQRAALALSLFLTLNQNLTTGPKVILLDDPVIFADDLNVLSFFDYLRSLAEEGGRQVFFATANEKIASLFRRKFRVFGNDFVDINLEPIEAEDISA